MAVCIKCALFSLDPGVAEQGELSDEGEAGVGA